MKLILLQEQVAKNLLIVSYLYYLHT